MVRYFLFLETLPRRRGSQRRKVKISRSANVRGTIGLRSRSRSQPQYTCRYAERGTVLCVMSRLPLFDISPSISPTYTRDPKGPLRPLAGGGRSRRSHAGRLVALAAVESRALHGPGHGTRCGIWI